MADLLEKIIGYAGEKGTLVKRGEMATRELYYDLVSVDDQLIEPPDLFAGRVAARYADRAPHVVRDDHGVDWWVFGAERVPLLGSDGMQSWERHHGYLGPVNFDEMHPA